MVTYIRFRISSNETSTYIHCISNAMEYLKSNDDQIKCELSKCMAEEENFIIRIHWNKKAQIDTMTQHKAAFSLFLSEISDYNDDILELRTYKILKRVP